MFRSYDSSNTASVLSSLLLLFLDFFLLLLFAILTKYTREIDMKLDQKFKIDLMFT